MKAVVLNSFGRAGNFTVVELPLPQVREGEVRIRVKAAAFNPIDYQIRTRLPEGSRVQSMILGRDLAGTVDAVHESVTDFSVGDAVYSYVCTLASSGTYAEYVSVPAELVARKPASLTYEEAAAVPVAAVTASLALKKARAGKTTSVFVAGGAGGVGTFAIRLARQLGVRRLVTTAGNAKSREYLIEQCELNDDQIVDYREGDFIQRALRRNGGRFDAVLDLVGGSMLSACCTLLAIDGNLASVTGAPDRNDFEYLFERNASFHAVGANAYSLTSDRVAWRRYRAMLEHLAQQFDSGELAPPPSTILGSLSAEVVEQAHVLLEGNAVQGKLVMTC